MNIRFDEHGTLCVVEVDGEFVGDSVDPFRRACLDRIDSGVRDLIIDLSMTTLVDSAALETMLQPGRCPRPRLRLAVVGAVRGGGRVSVLVAQK